VDKRILEMCREIDAAKLATAQEGVTAWAEKLLEDAERYRWLRTRPVEDCTTPRIEVNMWTCNVSDEGISDSVNDGEVLAGKTLDAAIDRELVLKTGIPVDDCNQGLSLIKRKTLRIMSAYDEHEVRERLRKTRERLK